MVFSNNLLLGVGGQSTDSSFNTTLIGNSVWLDGSADFLSAELGAKTRTKAVIGTWIQKTGFSNSDATIFSKKGTTQFAMRMQDQANKAGKFSIFDWDGSANKYAAESTSMLLRDNGWYHIMISIDTTAIAGNRLRYYINGIDQTDTLTVTADYTLNYNPNITGGSGEPTQWGVGYTGTSQFNPCYLTQSFMLDDDSIQNGDVAVTDILDAFTLGTNGSQFTPKSDAAIAALATTAGGDSFCLDFANSADLGNDISSNNNDFTATSMTAVNQTGSSPSSAFATWNPLRVNTQTQTFAEGNLRFSSTQTSTNPAATGNYGVSSGKFYWEVFVVAQGNTSNILGICDTAAGLEDDTTALYASALMYGYEFAGTKRNNNSSASYGDSITTGDIVGVALDMDNGGVYFSKNGTFQASGDPTSGASLTNAAFTGLNSAGSGVFQPYYLAYSSGDGVANFGQSPTFNGQTTAGGNTDANGRGNFKHSVPSGYTALTSANITEPSYQGIDYFAPTLYEGNGTGQRVGDFVPFTDAFNVANSAMFQHDEARALSRTAGAPSSSGGKKGTWSTWYKTAIIDTDNIFFDNGTTATNRFSLQMDASGQIVFSYAGTTILMTNADLKGGGLWRNLVLKVDTSLATASARAIMYIDGVEVTSFATDARASLTQDGELGYMDSGATQFVGSYNGSSANQWDGYLAETIFLDNQFLSADSFGQLDTSTNKWVPKAISSLTLGDQGFYLAYGGNFGTGNGAGDSTGNSNNLTEIGTWTSADKFVDTPTKNFTTFDPGYSGGGSNVWSEGNTKVQGTDGSLSDSSTTTFGMTGKVVFQFQINTVVSGGYPQVGFITSQAGLSAINAASGSIEMGTASVPGSFAYTNTGTFKIPAGTESTTFSSVTSLQALDADDVIRFEVDTSAGTIRAYFQNEGTGSFSEITGARVDNFSFDSSFGIRPAVSNFNNSIVTLQTGGQTTLASVTTAYKEINQDNLDDTQSKITAWAWIKNRDATDNHILIDRVRGVGNDIHSNDTAIEVFNANTVQRFLQRGVQVGSDVEVNTANESYVLWQWLLGDSATTGTVIPASGSNPTLASTSLASDNGSFGICTYTGDATAGSTVKHSLDGIPEMILFKRYGTTTANWMAYHKDAGASNTDYLLLDNTAAKGAFGAINWLNATTPTSTLVTLGSDSNNNAADKFIMYLFRSIAGVCKVGSYTGSGDANGPYISTGFEPSFIMIKRAVGGAGDWNILDTSREPFNAASPLVIRANLTNAGEAGSIGDFDILSDGFKLKAVSANANTASSTYIYLAMSDIGGNGTLPPVYGR